MAGYYVWRIIPEEEECDGEDSGMGVDRIGLVCYGECDGGDRGLGLNITLLCAYVSSKHARELVIRSRFSSQK